MRKLKWWGGSEHTYKHGGVQRTYIQTWWGGSEHTYKQRGFNLKFRGAENLRKRINYKV